MCGSTAIRLFPRDITRCIIWASPDVEPDKESVSCTGICRLALEAGDGLGSALTHPARERGELSCRTQKQSNEHNVIKKKENRHRLRRESLYAKRFIMCARENTERVPSR